MSSRVVSGGELYNLRSLPQFQFAASYIRGRWPKAGISFGLYDAALGTADVLRPTLANALAACDEVVWMYAEVLDALNPAQAPLWVSAIPTLSPPGKALIYHGKPGFPAVTTPDVLASLPHIKTLPFDGIVVYLRDKAMTLNATASINSSTPISYDQLMSILAPIRNLDLGNLKRNYAFVLGNSPPDVVSGDWMVVIQNWMNLARACKDSGLKGIFLDNENYGGTFGKTPATGDPMAYKVSARALGLGIMVTMLQAFPDIEIIHTHGPYVSYADALTALGANPGWAAANDLLSPFFEGMLSAVPDPVPVPPLPPLPVATPDLILDAILGVKEQLLRLNDTIDAALQRRNL